MTVAGIHRVEADGVSVFYREAGPADGPVVLLLHAVAIIIVRIIIANVTAKRLVSWHSRMLFLSNAD